MQDLVYTLIHSDVVTKLFIAGSIIVLGILQAFLIRKPYPFISIAIILILFGLLLGKLSVYSPFVHLVVYVLPSFLLSGFILFFLPKKKDHKLADPLALTYQYDRG